MTTSWFRSLAEWLGIGTVEDCTVSAHLAAHDRRLDHLDARVRALEADVAARTGRRERDDSADPADPAN